MQIVVLFWVRKFTHLHEKDNYIFDSDDSLVFVTTLLFSKSAKQGPKNASFSHYRLRENRPN